MIAVLEAMKMEHELTAPAAGILSELRVGAGEQVESGAVIGIIEPAGDPPKAEDRSRNRPARRHRG